MASKEYDSEYYQKNKERITARHKQYAIENKDALAVKQKEWALLNKERIQKQNKEGYQKLTARERKDRDLRCKYGITLAQYDEMIEQQKHQCACCGISETALLKKYPNSFHACLAVDHCHESLKVRALLCNSCNMFVGLLESRKELLPSALNYIAEHGQS